MSVIELKGNLIGTRTHHGEIVGEVIYIKTPFDESGPAENAFVYVERGKRARYVSWINLYDIEHAGRRQSNQWKTVEPGQLYHKKVEWLPYGWGGDSLPSVADPELYSLDKAA